MDLEHRDPDCTGSWERRESADGSHWLCRCCGAWYTDSTRTALAAFRENTLGDLMRDLARRRRR